MKPISMKTLRQILLLTIGFTSPITALSAADKAKSENSKAVEASNGTEGTRNTATSVPIVFETWTFYFDEIDRNATSIYFEPGSAFLSTLERNRLMDWTRVLRDADKSGVSAIVASWSDKPYPEKAGTSLTKADRDLAERRNENIRAVLKEAGVSSVESFSMAERPNWFQKTFATDSAQIKGEARDKQWDAKNEELISRIISRRGGPYKSVVLFRPLERSQVTGR